MKNISIPFGQACLSKAAEILFDDYYNADIIDFSSINIILPGMRAGRRFKEILCEISDERQVSFVPPKISTAGSFRDDLVSKFSDVTLASDVDEMLAWNNAIIANPSAIKEICSVKNSLDSFDMARTLRSLYRELAGDGIKFQTIAELELDDFNESERWAHLTTIFDSYVAELESNNLTDIYLESEKVLSQLNQNPELMESSFADISKIYVIGVVDSFKHFSEILALLKDKLTVISHGPQNYFDDLGLLKKVGEITFNDFRPDLNNIKFFDTQLEQAQSCVDFMAECSQYSPTDIVVSVPDEEVIPKLMNELKLAKVNSQNALGATFQDTDLGALLSASSTYLQQQNFSSLWGLLNHPLIERYLSVEIEKTPANLMKLRKRAAKHLLDLIDESSLQILKYEEAEIEKILSKVDALLKPLRAELTLMQWPPVINKFLENIYRAKAESREINEKHFDVVDKWVRLSSEIVKSKVAYDQKLTFMAALKHMTSMLKGDRVKDTVIAKTIDLIGWLEMPLEDAPVIILTGMNEGKVPQSVVSDQFLPNHLRSLLGIKDNQSRFNRDRYFFQSIISSCQKYFISASRFSSSGDPLKLSRILLDLPASQQAQLIKEFIKPETVADANDLIQTDVERAEYDDFLASDTGLELSRKPEHYSASKLNSYLECPYSYFLKQQKLSKEEEIGIELDALKYGNFVHGVLEIFGKSDLKDSDDVSQLQKYLEQQVDLQAQREYGLKLHPVLELQLDSIKSRLTKFAEVQAKSAAEGWKIVAVEEKIDYELSIPETPDKKVKISGFIDRIDLQGDKVRLLDYKTGNSVKAPDKVHFKDGEWLNLQLPIYADFIKNESKYRDKEIAVGYFSLPSKMHEIKIDTWEEFDEEILISAKSKIGTIVQLIEGKNPQKFARTEDRSKCEWCDYKQICQRG